MFRGLILLVGALLVVVPNIVCALETVRVVVLPFEVHSIKDLSYMKTEVSGIIKKHLKQAGAVVVDLELPPEFSWEKTAAGMEDIRKLGVEGGADYVVWGSLTWIGQQFSMDAKLMKTFGQEPPSVVFAEGKGVENLLGTVKKLTDKISLKLFKRETVAEVLVAGNKRIESDAIKRVIKTAPGDVLLATKLSDDLKAVYSMGYFDDIRIETTDGATGKIITFKVKEKPTVREIRLKGNKHIKDEDIQQALTIRTGSILNINRVYNGVEQIKNLYREENYHNVQVTYEIQHREHNQADLKFMIEEGEKVRIKIIIFEGNSAYADKQLKKMMETSEKGFFSWLTESGDLNRETLSQDIAKLAAFYHNHGYIQAKIGEPIIEFKENWIYITIKIDEGPQFKVGHVDLAGDLIASKEELLKKLRITQETFFNREVVRNDVLALTDFYSDEGYAYAEITPKIAKDFNKLKVDILYDVQKKKQVYFETIRISGNTKTRDKVIRRQLKVYEQELYSGRGLKRGIRNLYRLDYFEDIKVDTLKGSSDDKMNLNIDVTEKATGTFTFGGGYSSTESAFISASVTQRNLFGRGQLLELRTEIGGRTTRYDISFTEPWLFDIPLSARVDLYKYEFDYDVYDKDSLGGGVKFGYPVFPHARGYLGYRFENGEITNVAADAPNSILDLEEQTLTTSSFSTSLHYDTRNRLFNATEGQDHSISLEYSGLGGDIGFIKILTEAGWFFPLYKSLVSYLHGEAGYVTAHSGKILPDWERFYLGGIDSLRGFGWRDVSPTEINRNGYQTRIGGDKYVQFNVETKFPLIKEQAVWGVVFVDAGNVYNDDENLDLTDLRKSIGFGVRWYSPMGPLRLEYGYIIDPEEGQGRGGRWEFTMGGAF